MNTNKTIHPVDTHVGTRIRLRRKVLKISQQQLGAALGLTFQQVQKYERGFNRTSASKLFDIAAYLGVPVSYFFEGLDTLGSKPFSEDTLVRDFITHPKIIRIAEGFSKLAPAGVDSVLSLVEHMATKPE